MDGKQDVYFAENRRRVDFDFPFNRESLISLTVLLLTEAPPSQLFYIGDVETSDKLYDVLVESFDDGGRRLRLSSGDLHADFDKYQSEAELRDALVPTLPVAVIAVILNLSLPWVSEALSLG